MGTECSTRYDMPDPIPPDGVNDEGDEYDGAERGPNGDRDDVVVRFKCLRCRGRLRTRSCN